MAERNNMNFSKITTKVAQISQNHIIFEMELTESVTRKVFTACVVVDRKLDYTITTDVPSIYLEELEQNVRDENENVMKVSKFIFGYKD